MKGSEIPFTKNLGELGLPFFHLGRKEVFVAKGALKGLAILDELLSAMGAMAVHGVVLFYIVTFAHTVSAMKKEWSVPSGIQCRLLPQPVHQNPAGHRDIEGVDVAHLDPDPAVAMVADVGRNAVGLTSEDQGQFPLPEVILGRKGRLKVAGQEEIAAFLEPYHCFLGLQEMEAELEDGSLGGHESLARIRGSRRRKDHDVEIGESQSRPKNRPKIPRIAYPVEDENAGRGKRFFFFLPTYGQDPFRVNEGSNFPIGPLGKAGRLREGEAEVLRFIELEDLPMGEGFLDEVLALDEKAVAFSILEGDELLEAGIRGAIDERYVARFHARGLWASFAQKETDWSEKAMKRLKKTRQFVGQRIY